MNSMHKLILALKKILTNENILLITILVFVFWRLFSPGAKVANDFPYVSKPALLENMPVPNTWATSGSNGFGENSTLFLWAWPSALISGFVSYIGFDFELIQKIFFFLPIILIATYSIRRLLLFYKYSDTAILISSIFYLLNTYFILLVDGGQINIALAYAIFPLAFLSVEKSINGGFVNLIKSGMTISILGSFDIRFLFILLVLAGSKIIYLALVTGNKFRLILNWMKSGLFIGLFLILINAYWIIPYIVNPLSGDVLQNFTNVVGRGFTDIKHALLLISPHWYLNVFGMISPIRREFIMIPVMVFLLPLTLLITVINKVPRVKTLGFYKYLNRIMHIRVVKISNLNLLGFWTITALIGVFLAKGSNPPFGEIYNFLFNYFPGFSLFRDSTKFFFLVSLSYAVILGFSVNIFTETFNQNIVITPRNRVWFNQRKLKIQLSSIVSLFLIAYFLLLISPVWLGKMTGTLSKPANQNVFLEVHKIFELDDYFGRILWLPSIPPLGYFSPNHPAIEGLRIYQQRPFNIGVVGSYEYLNFLREAPFMGELFKIFGIKYIAYPYPDTRREILKQDNVNYYHTFLDQLSNLPWIEKRITDIPVPVLKTKEVEDRFFLPFNSFYVVGSDRIYWDLMKLQGFDLSNNALLFAEEFPGLMNNLSDNGKILLYNKSETDLSMSFVDRNYFYFPATYIKKEPNEKQKFWSRNATDLIWWRNFLQTKYGVDNLDFDYGGGWVVGEGDQQLSTTGFQFSKGERLFARVMESSRGGTIEFWQGENLIGLINTLVKKPEKVKIKLSGYKDVPDKISVYDQADFMWHEIGKFVIDEPIIMKTYGDINVINALVNVSTDETNRIDESIHRYKVIDWKSIEQDEKMDLFRSGDAPQISYLKVNPTHYKVRVSKLTKPTMLAFSDTYNPQWMANGYGSIPIYGLINGFMISTDGEYDVNFAPQKYVIPGLIISVVTFLISVGTLLRVRRRITSN